MQVSDIHDYARQLWACTETRLAQSQPKRRWKAISVASIRKRRIGGAFVMRSPEMRGPHFS